jgi:hypothetical protein
MSKESKPQKSKKSRKPIEVLKLDRETVQDLTDRETEQLKGGVRGGAVEPKCLTRVISCI